MPMKYPVRPGSMVGSMMKELGMSVAEAARNMGVSQAVLNDFIDNENTSVSEDMAARLERVFGSTADNWVRMQAAYDAAQERNRLEAQKPKSTKQSKPILEHAE